MLAKTPWLNMPVLTAAASILAPLLLGRHMDRNFDLADGQIALLSLPAALLPGALSIGLYWFLLPKEKDPKTAPSQTEPADPAATSSHADPANAGKT